jgi:hypothetical protein
MKKGVHGEGNYEAAREYNERTKEYLESADVDQDARNAAPGSEAEARALKQAEAEGKKHAKGGAASEGASKAMDSDDA